MNKLKISKSLFVKLPVLVLFVIITTGYLSLYFTKNSVRSKATSSIEETIRLTLGSMDWAVASLINSKDHKSLQRLIENAGSNRLMSELKVCSNNYNTLASSDPSDVGSKCSSITITDLIKGKKLISISYNTTEGTIEAAVPVTGPKYNHKTKNSNTAVIYLKVNDSYINSTFESYKNFMIEYSVILSFVLSSVLLIILYRFVFRPLSLYKNAISGISKGNYNVDLVVKNQDELGEFANAINVMSKEILLKQSELKSTNKHLSEYMKALDESSIVIRSNISGKITYANKKFYDITGYSRSEIEGKSIMDFRGGLFKEKGVIDYWETVLQNFVWKETVVSTDKDGKKFYVNATVCPIQAADGEIIELIDIWSDITEIYQLQDELRHHKENLEEIVRSRTKDLITTQDRYKKLYTESNLMNKELVNAQNTIIQQEKLASIGQLAAGVAHELNNPIGFISSNFDVLKNYFVKISDYVEYADEMVRIITEKCSGSCGIDLKIKHAELGDYKKKKKVDYIISDTKDLFDESEHGFQRITSIVNSLRDFSRIDYEDNTSPYNLNEGLENTLIITKNETKYTAEIITEYGEIPDIKCNGGEINQVLLNIIVNASQAIKGSSVGKGIIKIKTHTENNQVICIISDNGPGIQNDKINKIFDPFYTTKAPGEGTGLGLNISYDIIVNKHKGELSVDCSDGWTSFTIKLPLEAK